MVWKDSLGLNSAFSEDGGENFSNIYLWNKSKLDKYIRYDYKENDNKEKHKFNSSFGTLYPDIKLVGFGKLKDAEEIIRNKKLK